MPLGHGQNVLRRWVTDAGRQFLVKQVLKWRLRGIEVVQKDVSSCDLLLLVDLHELNVWFLCPFRVETLWHFSLVNDVNPIVGHRLRSEHLSLKSDGLRVEYV